MPEQMKEALLRDLTRPVAVGERINMHVIQQARQKEPDYEAMRRVIAGSQAAGTHPAQDDQAA